MAMIRSIFTGVSGLQQHQTKMDIVGNNIANVNTIGFKRGRISFEEVFAVTLRGAVRPSDNLGGINPIQLGLGTNVGSIDTIFSQGTLESSEQVTDLAIQGDGFFVLSDGQQKYYTRSGAFIFDATGALVNPNNGTYVQGKMADATGNIPVNASIGNIVLPFGQKSPARATTAVSFTGNLDASATPDGTILQTKKVYALELSGRTQDGSNSNVQGLLAVNETTGVTTLLEGITENTTTVSVNDGIDRNQDGVVDEDDAFDFTYVSSNTASPYDFYSIQDLVDGINEVFSTASPTGTPSLTATFDDDSGQITFTRVYQDGGEYQRLQITSTNSNLQAALESANLSDTTTASSASNTFLHVSRDEDLMTNLYDADGDSLALNVDDLIFIQGVKGTTEIAQDRGLVITSETTYSDYTEQIRKAFGIVSDAGGVVINSDGGVLQIRADGGTDNAISSVNIQAFTPATAVTQANANSFDPTDTTAYSATSSTFNAIFDSTPNNYIELQEATDVQAAASATVFDSLGQQQCDHIAIGCHPGRGTGRRTFLFLLCHLSLP